MTRSHTARALALLLAAAFAAGLLAGCSAMRADEPVSDTREALGTFVSVTAYPAEGADEAAVRAAIDEAYAAMADVEAATNAYDEDGKPIIVAPGEVAPGATRASGPATSVAEFNRSGAAGLLPEAVTEVLDAVERLDVAGEFSVSLLGVTTLYDFDGEEHSIAEGYLETAVSLAKSFSTTDTYAGVAGTFQPVMTIAAPVAAGLDLGGAAKGLALDAAVEALRGSGVIDAALVTAGSTTIAFGSKPSGEPWRIGIEDPRDPEATVAAIESTGTVIVSTSGDYQRYFEIDGVRYHHILDPETGRPARGIRSLTVVGTRTGLDSDILSTALFVMGPERSAEYAKKHGLGLYVIDDEGRATITPGPDDRTWEITEQ